MRVMHWRALLGAALIGTGLLAACGGGGGGDGGTNQPPAAATGAVAGVVRSSATQQPVANATVRAQGQSATTAANGSFTLSGVPVGDRVVVSVEAAGHVDAKVNAEVVQGQTTTIAPRLVLASPTVDIRVDTASTVTAPDSVAAVDLGANSLVVQATGAAATGTVQARVTPIDPAADPQSMPGDYSAANDTRIESFGAIEVRLTDAGGAPLNLKAGSTATIRIPVATRSADIPASIPLYYFNESTGLWVQEGTATLKGLAPDQYYEGTVTHFSYWNADRPQETIYVNGCVNDAAGRALPYTAVRTSGLDYTGTGQDVTDAQGRFRVPMRKGGVAKLWAEQTNDSNTVVVGPSQTDITLPDCLAIPDGILPPVVLQAPQATTVNDGDNAYFTLAASGSRPLIHQWLRDGTPIAGAVGEFLVVPSVSFTADNGARFSVRVTNGAGAVTSAEAVLTVRAPVAPTITQQPANASVPEGAVARFIVVASGSAPFTYEWRRNGTTVPNSNVPILDFPSSLVNDGDVFTVQVSNRAGNTVSAPATLRVTATPLAITVQPVGITASVGATARFAVTAVGSPPIAYQWRRNGADIAGATQATYDTPVLALADSGAVFTVVVSNGRETVTSQPATLTVVDRPPQSEEEKFTRLLTLLFEYISPAFLPFEATDAAGTRFISTAAFCRAGSASFTLNGSPVVAGAAVPLSGTLAATATDCAVSDVTRYNGSSSLAYTARSLAPADFSATATLTNARVTNSFTFGGNTTITTDVTSLGVLTITGVEAPSTATTTTTTTFRPGAGAAIRNEMSGITAQFSGGALTLQIVENNATTNLQVQRTIYDGLRITLGGVEYLLSGTTEVTFGANNQVTGTGEVVVTANGTRIGREYYDASGALQLELTGTVQPF